MTVMFSLFSIPASLSQPLHDTTDALNTFKRFSPQSRYRLETGLVPVNSVHRPGDRRDSNTHVGAPVLACLYDS